MRQNWMPNVHFLTCSFLKVHYRLQHGFADDIFQRTRNSKPLLL
jgi:hypothetical protein